MLLLKNTEMLKVERHLTLGARLVFKGILCLLAKQGNLGAAFDKRKHNIHPVFTDGIPVDATFDEMEAVGLLKRVGKTSYCMVEPTRFLVEKDNPKFTGTGPSGYGRNLSSALCFCSFIEEELGMKYVEPGKKGNNNKCGG